MTAVADPAPRSRAGLAARWIARLVSLGALYAVVQVLRTHGYPDSETGSTAAILETFFLHVGVVGLAIGWKWEGAGGTTAVSGMVAIYVVSLLATRSLPATGSLPATWTPSMVGGGGFLFILSRVLNVAATHESHIRSRS